jgi:hypothetical protein
MVLHADLAELVSELLPGLREVPVDHPSGTLAPRPAGRSWWGWALIAAGLLFMGYAAVNSLTGYSTTVTVVSGDTDPDDGFCPAVWVDPAGERQHGEADCADEPAGT